MTVNSSQLVQLGLKLFEYTDHLSNVKLPRRNSFFEWGNPLSRDNSQFEIKLYCQRVIKYTSFFFQT